MSDDVYQKPKVECAEWTDPDHSAVVDDAWHDHTGEAPPHATHGATTPGAIALVGLTGFGLTLAMMGAVWFYFGQANQAEYIRKVERAQVDAEAQETRAAWESELRDYGWVDGPAGVIHAPVEATIDRVAERYAEGAP